jgi:predicted esterase
VRALNVETTTHGRVLIEDAAGVFSGRLLVGFHGYGQSAGHMLDELKRIPGADAWRLVAVQALHRFYTRGDRDVVANWMTREDRELAIADNIAYVDRALAGAGAADARAIVYLGFSQGASMAARAAVRGKWRAAGLVMLGGDIPADVRDAEGRWPPVLVGCGHEDAWYGARLGADAAFLAAAGVPHDIVRFVGGHEFTDEFRAAAGRWLARGD